MKRIIQQAIALEINILDNNKRALKKNAAFFYEDSDITEPDDTRESFARLNQTKTIIRKIEARLVKLRAVSYSLKKISPENLNKLSK